jgi:hypothetical protein
MIRAPSLRRIEMSKKYTLLQAGNPLMMGGRNWAVGNQWSGIRRKRLIVSFSICTSVIPLPTKGLHLKKGSCGYP